MQIENDAQDARRSATTLSAAHHTLVQSAMPERFKKISVCSTDILPTRLLYGCVWNTVQTRELDIIWNNAFRCIFNCCWRESVKHTVFVCNIAYCAFVVHD